MALGGAGVLRNCFGRRDFLCRESASYQGRADRAAKKREKEDEQRRERYILQMDSRKATFDLLSCICAGIERMETETGQIYWNGELKRCLSHLEGVDERYRESDQRQLAELNTRNK